MLTKLAARCDALVTGGAGFIGSHLIDALVARGDEVLVIDDLSSGRARTWPTQSAREPSWSRRASSTPPRWPKRSRATVPIVFHLAAQIDVRRSVADPVLRPRPQRRRHDQPPGAVARQHDVARVLFASTGGAIYGEGDGRELPLNESAEPSPTLPTGSRRLRAEGYLSLYSPPLRARGHARCGSATSTARARTPTARPGVVAIFCGAALGGGDAAGLRRRRARRATTSTSTTSPPPSSPPPRRRRRPLQRRHRHRDQRARARQPIARGLRARVRPGAGAGPRRRGPADLDRPRAAPRELGWRAGHELDRRPRGHRRLVPRRR